MGKKISCTVLVLGTLWLASCGKSSDSAPVRATALLRDGTRISGTVTSSSPNSITIVGDDKASHVISMQDVRRIDYEATADSAAGIVHDDHPHPTEAAVATKTHQLAAGTQVSVRNEETIDSGKAVEGQIYAAEVTRDVLDASGDVVIPRGSNAQIVIKSASRGGKIRGAADLVLDLHSISIDGREYRLSTSDLEQKGRDAVGANKRTAAYSGGGAAIGAVIGAIAGGGKGAAIGAGAGAGAGALTQTLTKGQIRVPAETVLTFQLDRPLSVVASR